VLRPRVYSPPAGAAAQSSLSAVSVLAGSDPPAFVLAKRSHARRVGGGRAQQRVRGGTERAVTVVAIEFDCGAADPRVIERQLRSPSDRQMLCRHRARSSANRVRSQAARETGGVPEFVSLSVTSSVQRIHGWLSMEMKKVYQVRSNPRFNPFTHRFAFHELKHGPFQTCERVVSGGSKFGVHIAINLVARRTTLLQYRNV